MANYLYFSPRDVNKILLTNYLSFFFLCGALFVDSRCKTRSSNRVA